MPISGGTGPCGVAGMPTEVGTNSNFEQHACTDNCEEEEARAVQANTPETLGEISTGSDKTELDLAATSAATALGMEESGSGVLECMGSFFSNLQGSLLLNLDNHIGNASDDSEFTAAITGRNAFW